MRMPSTLTGVIDYRNAIKEELHRLQTRRGRERVGSYEWQDITMFMAISEGHIRRLYNEELIMRQKLRGY